MTQKRKSRLIDFNEFEKRFPKVKKSKSEKKEEARKNLKLKKNDIWHRRKRATGAGFSNK